MGEKAEWFPPIAPAPTSAAPLTEAEARELDAGPSTLERNHELLYRDMMFGRVGAVYKGLFS